jgi:hypothetical protein
MLSPVVQHLNLNIHVVVHLQMARSGVVIVMLCLPEQASAVGPQDQAPRVVQQTARGPTAHPVGGKLTLMLVTQWSSFVLLSERNSRHAADAPPELQSSLLEQ